MELGGIEAIKDRVRDVRAGSLVDSLWHDVRWAARLLARYPLFTLTAALSLAVGIGATTAIFTIANGLLLRTATGISEPDRIVDIIRLERDDGPGIAELSFPTLRDVRERTTTLEAVYAYRLQPSTVSLRIEAEAAEAAFATLATNNFFSTLGVRAAAGRLFPPGEDDRPGADPIVVLGHRFWQRRFQGDPSNRRPVDVSQRRLRHHRRRGRPGVSRPERRGHRSVGAGVDDPDGDAGRRAERAGRAANHHPPGRREVEGWRLPRAGVGGARADRRCSAARVSGRGDAGGTSRRERTDRRLCLERRDGDADPLWRPHDCRGVSRPPDGGRVNRAGDCVHQPRRGAARARRRAAA